MEISHMLEMANISIPAEYNYTGSYIEAQVPQRLPGLFTQKQYILFTKIYVALWFSISVFGIWSNTVNLRTYFKMDRDESVIIVFLMLSFSDFFICNISAAEAISTVIEVIWWSQPRPLYIHPVIVNVYLSLFRRMFTVMTVLTTIFLAIQRCLCVVLPFRIKGLFTPFRTFLFISLPCVVSTTAFIVYAAQYKTAKITDPKTNVTSLILLLDQGRNNIRVGLSIATGIVLNVTAQVVILACLVVMGIGLRKAIRFKKSATSGGDSSQTAGKSKGVASDQEKQQSKETQALIQVTLVATIFVIINTPFLIAAITGFFVPGLDLYKRYSYLYIILYRIVFLCELINSSVNFFVYYNYNSRFRNLCFKA